MLTIFAILWLLVWALTVFDLFRRDWSVTKKVLWTIGMLIFPVVGVIAYLIVRPPSASDLDPGTASRGLSDERARDHHQV